MTAKLVKTEAVVEGRTEVRWTLVEEDDTPEFEDGAATRPIGEPTPRITARARTTGSARFTVDIALPGLLEAAVLRSPHANARVTSLDLDAARAVPGVRCVPRVFHELVVLHQHVFHVGLIVFKIVDGVNPAARPFLDWPARSVFLLRALLAAKTLGRGRRAEVRAPIPAARSAHRPAATATARARRESASTAARTRAEASATAAATEAAGAWATEPATARTRASKAAAPRARRWSILAGARLAYGERAALEWLCVELTDDLLRHGALDEFDESESARTASLAIDRHDDVRRFGDGGEVGPKIRFAGPVGKISDEQTDCQGSLVKTLPR